MPIFRGALIASGQMVVDTNVKKVQTSTGGVVGEVRVRDGDNVKAGDVWCGSTIPCVKASLAIVVKTLNGCRRAPRGSRPSSAGSTKSSSRRMLTDHR